MKTTTTIAAAAVLALSGCASIIQGGTQPVTIRSVPDGAAITVSNRNGEKVHAGTAPVTLTLNRGAGYFKPESYTIVVSKDGFDRKEMTITGTLSGWYIGNIVFGGLIGMLAVDPVTGAMYTLPDAVTATLDGTPAKAAQAQSTLTVVSTESLTPQQRQQARLLTAAR